jgi:hypothetical protein
MDPAENFSKYKELQLVHLKVNTPIDDPSCPFKIVFQEVFKEFFSN